MMEGNQEEGYEEDYLEGDFDNENLDEDYSEGIDVGGSEPKPLGGLYAFFNSILTAPRSTKVSNLNKEELGNLGISIRESMRIALLGRKFGHPKFAKFFMDQAGIVSDSAMSKEGWFTELAVTSKSYASRASSSSVQRSLPQNNKEKWKLFSAKRNKLQKQ